MIRINDIKDDELRELAYKRTLEINGTVHLEYVKKRNVDLHGCFSFEKTKEGMDYWWEVCTEGITKLEQS